jgi:hypothetical protein
LRLIGPGKFLRGKGGIQSAEKAVQVLEDKAEITLTYFMLGLYCIVLSSAFKAFILYTLWNACIVAFGLSLMTYTLITAGKVLEYLMMFVKVGGFSTICMWTKIKLSGEISPESRLMIPLTLNFNDYLI